MLERVIPDDPICASVPVSEQRMLVCAGADVYAADDENVAVMANGPSLIAKAGPVTMTAMGAIVGIETAKLLASSNAGAVMSADPP